MPATKPIAPQTMKPPGLGVFDDMSESITDEVLKRGSIYAEPKVSVRDQETGLQYKTPDRLTLVMK